MWEVQNRVLNSVKQVLNTVKRVLNSVKQVLNTVKQVLNSVKHGQISLRTQSNGRVNLPDPINPSWDPEYGVCSLTPRFSYGCPELTICACPSGPAHRPSRDM